MKRPKGFTKAELLTAVVVIVFLAAILIPTLGVVNKERAYRAGCAANPGGEELRWEGWEAFPERY